VAMTWAQRLKRVFKIDIETCRVCGDAVRVIKTFLAYREEAPEIRSVIQEKRLGSKTVAACRGYIVAGHSRWDTSPGRL